MARKVANGNTFAALPSDITTFISNVINNIWDAALLPTHMLCNIYIKDDVNNTYNIVAKDTTNLLLITRTTNFFGGITGTNFTVTYSVYMEYP